MAELLIDPKAVAPEISPNDEMYLGGESWYFPVGQSAIDCLDCALKAARKPISSVQRILDLPCGHGRVLRYLRAAFPQAEITACDLLRDGVDFCAKTFGAIPVYSQDEPSRIPIPPESFDLIWVGSLLTHLDQDRWRGFLTAFRSFLRPGGVLVFTSHGHGAYQRVLAGPDYFAITEQQKLLILDRYARQGFGYVQYPPLEGYYGLSLAKPTWVIDCIREFEDLKVALLSEKGWADFHDIYACVRDDSWHIQSPVVPRRLVFAARYRKQIASIRRRVRLRTRLRAAYHAIKAQCR